MISYSVIPIVKEQISDGILMVMNVQYSETKGSLRFEVGYGGVRPMPMFVPRPGIETVDGEPVPMTFTNYNMLRSMFIASLVTDLQLTNERRLSRGFSREVSFIELDDEYRVRANRSELSQI